MTRDKRSTVLRQKDWTPRRGIEPRSPAWQAGILDTILSRRAITITYVLNAARFQLTTFGFGIQCSASWATHPLHLASHFYVNYTHSLHPVQVTTAIMCTLVSCHKKTKEKSWWLQSNALPLSYKRISSAQRESHTWPFECYSNSDNLNPNLMFIDQNQVHSLLY